MQQKNLQFPTFLIKIQPKIQLLFNIKIANILLLNISFKTTNIKTCFFVYCGKLAQGNFLFCWPYQSFQQIQ